MQASFTEQQDVDQTEKILLLSIFSSHVWIIKKERKVPQEKNVFNLPFPKYTYLEGLKQKD